MNVGIKRNVGKTLTWLAVLAVTTLVLSHLATVEPKAFNWIGIAVFHGWLYFLHECVWGFFGFGIRPNRVFVTCRRFEDELRDGN